MCFWENLPPAGLLVAPNNLPEVHIMSQTLKTFPHRVLSYGPTVELEQLFSGFKVVCQLWVQSWGYVIYMSEYAKSPTLFADWCSHLVYN